MWIISFYIILLLWAAIFFYFFLRASQKNNYILWVAGIVPLILMLVYGIGGAFLLNYEPKDKYWLYQAYFTNFDLLCILIYSVVASIVYYAGFLLFGRSKLDKKSLLENWSNQLSIDIKKIKRVAIILLIFDLFVRFVELTSGVYFDWLSAFVKGLPWWKTSLFQINSSLVPILGVCLYLCSREKRWAKLSLTVLFILVLMEGDRSNFWIFLIPIVIAYFYFNRKQISIKLVVCVFFILIAFFGFIGPIIQEVRYEVRDDYRIILNDPVKLPAKLFTEYIPTAITFSRLYGDDSRRQYGGGLKERFIRWPAFWASINAKIWDGKPFRGLENMIRTMTMVVPSVFYPGEKPEIKAGPENLTWYNLFVSSNDPTSTVFQDVFAIGGILGLIGFSFIYGSLYGLFVRFLVAYWKSFGVIMVFGLLNLVIITHDSFGTVFVRFRDAILIIFLLVFLYKMPRFRFK